MVFIDRIRETVSDNGATLFEGTVEIAHISKSTISQEK